MAQAAFFVNELQIGEQGEHIVIYGQRRCMHGDVVDRVWVTLPIALKQVLVEAFGSEQPVEQATVRQSSEHFGDN